MEKKISRRSFITTATVTLSTVAVGNFKDIGIAGEESASKAVLDIDPHVIVKLYPGRSEQQKKRLAEAIVKDVVSIIRCGEDSVSVSIEEISPQDWNEKVYKLDILNKQKMLYKKPGYSM